jgi:hypothetical protein
VHKIKAYQILIKEKIKIKVLALPQTSASSFHRAKLGVCSAFVQLLEHK